MKLGATLSPYGHKMQGGYCTLFLSHGLGSRGALVRIQSFSLLFVILNCFV